MRLKVGKIVNTHSLKGEVKVKHLVINIFFDLDKK